MISRIGSCGSKHTVLRPLHIQILRKLEKLKLLLLVVSKMSYKVRNFIINCEECKKNKPMNYNSKPPMGNSMIVQRSWQKRFLGPYPQSKNGNYYILIVLDQLFRGASRKPLTNATAEALVKYLENEIFLVYDVPEIIVSDNDSQFDAKILKLLLKKYGVKHEHTPKYHPQPNASEIVNSPILAAIRACVNGKHKSWDTHLQEIAQALRNVIHNSSPYSPHYAIFGQHQILHGSNYHILRKLPQLAGNDMFIQSKAENLSQAQERIIQHFKEA